MPDTRFIRSAGWWCMLGGAIAAVGATVTAIIPPEVPATQLSAPYTPAVFRVTEVIWTLSHLLMFIGVFGLVRSDAIGTARLGRIGGWIALVGMALIVPSELAFAFFATETTDSMPAMLLNATIGVASMVAGLGLLLTGIAVARAVVWQGWPRFSPLLCGVFVFVVLVPVLVLEPEWYLWPIAGWSACFVILGAALVHYAREPRPGQQLAQRAARQSGL
jgi:hypothetical protein